MNLNARAILGLSEYSTVGYCNPAGYWDTTDYAISTLLYSFFQGQPTNAVADVEYPNEKCQSYELKVFFYYEYLTDPGLLKVQRLPSQITFTRNF